MVNRETYKMELELELKRVELEIKEKELEIHKNNVESIKIKEKIESAIPEEEVRAFIDSVFKSKVDFSNLSLLHFKLLRIGTLAYNNYCLEEEISNLCSLKEDLEDKMNRETIYGLPIE